MSPGQSGSVHVTRRFDVPVEQVFEAWVNPDLLQRWLAPTVEVDARAGGHFRLEVSKPEGAGPGQEHLTNWRTFCLAGNGSPLQPGVVVDPPSEHVERDG